MDPHFTNGGLMHRVNQRNFGSVEEAVGESPGVLEPRNSLKSKRSRATWLPCTVCGAAVRVPVEHLNHEGRDNE